MTKREAWEVTLRDMERADRHEAVGFALCIVFMTACLVLMGCAAKGVL